MSEQPTAPAGGGGNVFTRKMGPFPMWVWMALVLLVAIIYYMFRKNSGGSAQAQSQAAQAAGNTPGGVDASLVPQFVNQTYENVTPPPAPNVTVNNNPPPSGGGTSTPPGPSNLTETLSKGHVISPNHSKAVVGWSSANVGAAGATQLKVGIDGPGLGPGGSNNTNPVYRIIPASATTATFENLQKGHNYTVSITPIDAKGRTVGETGTINLKTT